MKNKNGLNHNLVACGLAVLLACVAIAQAVVIDDFESYTEAGNIADDTGGIWLGIPGSTSFPDIADDGAGNQFITNYGTSEFMRGAYRELGGHILFDRSVTTLDFDIWAATDSHDISFGFAHGGSSGSWSDMEAYITLVGTDIFARNGSASEVIAAGVVTPGTVFHIQIVADLERDTYDVYVDSVLKADDFSFRNGLDANYLDALKIYGWGGSDSADYVAVDNIELTSSAGAPITIDIADDVFTFSAPANATINMSRVSELHITDGVYPMMGCTINLNSEDSFFFLKGVEPSVAVSTFLSQIKVNGANAVLGGNVRVVQYAAGSVIIPQASNYKPLQVFSEQNFQGAAASLEQYTQYNTVSLGTMANNISSFILKRGYTATFAQNQDGTGYSKNYVAQDSDLAIGVMPGKLDNQTNFVRVFPWRWVSKKGSCDVDPDSVNADWHYNWSINKSSSLDWEYVGIRQTAYWPGLDQNWQSRGINHLSGFNEPANSAEDAYESLDNGSVDSAIYHWDPLLATGLRVGAPAVTDGGRSWLYSFMDAADNADKRVDYVPIHYYWCYWDNNDPAAAASQMYTFLEEVHNNVQKPLWVTEFNNGANWSGCDDPTVEQNKNVIEAMINMMDSVSWIERYAVYSNVEWTRMTHYDSGGLTPMGTMYRDHVAPIGYRQEIPGSGKSGNAIYDFESHFHDTSGNGNNPLAYGAPKRSAGQHGNALVLDGTDDYLRLTTNMAEDEDFTFAGWIYWDGGGNWQRVFDFGNGSSHYMFLTPNAGSTLRFTVTTNGWDGEQRLESAALPVDTWTHVAVTLSGDTGRLYVNGTEVDTQTITVDPSDLVATSHYLGKSRFSSDPLFDGMLDDVIIADYALSAAQISELMTTDQPQQFIPAPVNIVGVTFGAEQTGNPAVNAYDHNRSTRWANDGSVGNAWIQYDLGSVTEVDRIKLKFYSGTSRTYPIQIDVDGVQVFSGNTSTTSGYWETSFTPAGGRYVTVTMTGNNSSGNGWFGMWETQIWSRLNERPSFNSGVFNEIDAAELAVYNSTLADDAVDPESGSLSFSKDAGPDWLTVASDGTLSGTPKASDAGSNVFTVRVTDGGGLYETAEMTIQVYDVYYGTQGLEDLLGLASQWLTTDCGLCNGANLDGENGVTVSDLSVLARNWLLSEDLQLWLKFDDMTGTGVGDSSLYQRADGSLVNDPVWSVGHEGGALAFDGSNYVEVADADALNPNTDSLSIAFWMKSDAADQSAFIFSKRQTESPNAQYLIGLSGGNSSTWSPAGGKLTFVFRENNSRQRGGFTTSDVDFSDWTHVCLVLDRSASPDYMSVYINGISVGFEHDIDLALPVTINTSTPLYIGSNPSIPLGYQGLIDDVRFYNRVLTQQEIQEMTGL